MAVTGARSEIEAACSAVLTSDGCAAALLCVWTRIDGISCQLRVAVTVFACFVSVCVW